MSRWKRWVAVSRRTVSRVGVLMTRRGGTLGGSKNGASGRAERFIPLRLRQEPAALPRRGRARARESPTKGDVCGIFGLLASASWDRFRQPNRACYEATRLFDRLSPKGR